MKAQDFRIGNLVIDEDGKILPILSIGKDDIVYHTEHIFSAIFTLQGVPLTKEWLIKFGFEIQENTPFYPMVARRKDGFSVFVNDEGKLRFFSGIKSIDVPYVHQLQNLYFAIFGEELIIK